MRWDCGSGIPAQSLYLCDALSISSTRDEGGVGAGRMRVGKGWDQSGKVRVEGGLVSENQGKQSGKGDRRAWLMFLSPCYCSCYCWSGTRLD